MHITIRDQERILRISLYLPEGSLQLRNDVDLRTADIVMRFFCGRSKARVNNIFFFIVTLLDLNEKAD